MKFTFYRFDNYLSRVLLLISLTFYSCKEHSTSEKKIFVEPNNISDLNHLTDLDNPAIFMGSSFGRFIQINQKLGNYETLYQFTSKETRDFFIKDSLIEFYSKMKFTYELKLKSFNSKDSILYYDIVKEATKRRLSFPVMIENDSVKMTFKKLNIEEPFLLN